MAEPTVTVQGGRKLRTALKQAGVDVADLKAAHAQAAAVVADAGRGVVPRRSGALAASIRPAGTAGKAIVRAGGARVPYANVIHWGSPRRGIEATLFLSRPAETTEPQWSPIYLRALEAIIAQVEHKADGSGD